jgi:hypothetical protein
MSLSVSASEATALTILPQGALECAGAAIDARLRLVFPPRLFDHQVMPSRVTPAGWKRLLRRTPFVGLGWAKADLAPHAPAGLFVGVAHWSVFLVTRNVAGPRHLYWGDGQGPGLFAMVRAAVAGLHGMKIAGVGTAQVPGAGNAYAEGWDDDEIAMAAVDLTVNLTLALADSVAGVEEDPLLRLGESWSFTAEAAGSLAGTVLSVGGG